MLVFVSSCELNVVAITLIPKVPDLNRIVSVFNMADKRESSSAELERRQAFDEYLEATGVSEAIAAVLDNLRNEPGWPEHPKEYIFEQLAMRAGPHANILQKLREAEKHLNDAKNHMRVVRKRFRRRANKLRKRLAAENDAANPPKNL